VSNIVIQLVYIFD